MTAIKSSKQIKGFGLVKTRQSASPSKKSFLTPSAKHVSLIDFFMQVFLCQSPGVVHVSTLPYCHILNRTEPLLPLKVASVFLLLSQVNMSARRSQPQAHRQRPSCRDPVSSCSKQVIIPDRLFVPVL